MLYIAHSIVELSLVLINLFFTYSSFAEALEVIPSTLAENAGLNPIATVTDLRNKHACGFKNAGINVRKVSFGLFDSWSVIKGGEVV